ncbi:MAG: rhodanese-like domain-containing protein [Bacteroidales bacterium]|nr:rhodanese-like domain-containing protein [Bacteroidales bacterium]MBN2818898.1 rhodanese-like domain-containing protein [Bacteroidales bacterium]
MKTRIIISIVFISLGLILAAIPQNTTLKYKLSANEMLVESNNMVMYYSPDEVADLLVQKDPSIQLIDVRPPDQFEKFSLPGAINVPLTEILNEDYRDLLHQDVRYNIFYSNGSTDALKAWMIARQLGWKNNFVLQGGLNYFAELIMNPQTPPSTSPNDEIAKYQFRKGAQAALFGATSVSSEAEVATSAPKPPIQKKPSKKRVQGGC